MANVPSHKSGEQRADDAIARRDATLDVAIEREDWYSTAALSMAQVYSHHALQCFDSARHYAELALDACHMMEIVTPTTRKLKLDASDMSALENFYLGNFEQAASHIASAIQTAQLGLQEPKVLAGIEWTAALVDRWRTDSFASLHHALYALELYAPLDSPLNVARLRVVIADIALDIAQSFTSGYGDVHSNFIDLAATHLARAMKSSTMSGDPAGSALAELAYVRLSRLAGRNEDRLGILESGARQASALEDLPLLGQFLTALGDELGTLGNKHAAIDLYGRAVDALTQSDAPAYAIWPKRALLRFREQTI